MLCDGELGGLKHAILCLRGDRHKRRNGGCMWDNLLWRDDRLVPMLLLRGRRPGSRLVGRVGRRVVFVGRERVLKGLHCLRRRRK